jgi:hypothetical protein
MRYQSQNRWAGFAIVDRRWADYPVSDQDAVTPAPVMVVTFADGETIRAPFATAKGQPLNIGRGLSNAIAFYRARIARRCNSDPCDDGRGFCIDVPAITACTVTQKGADNLALFPHTVSVATAKLRRGTFNLARVKEEARDRRLPLLATGDALDEAKLIARRYQRAAARHLLAHPQLMEKYRGIRAVEDIRHIATSKDLTLNKPTTPPGRARNQFMTRPKKTWRTKTWRIAA